MSKLQGLAINLTRLAAEQVWRSVRAMPEERTVWQPSETARTVLHQVVECGGMNAFLADALTARALPPFDISMLSKLQAEHDTVNKALALLEHGTDRLVSAIEAFPDAHLEETLLLPFGGGMEKSFAEVMLIPYWNMTYHLGQINYVQTLYGDREHH